MRDAQFSIFHSLNFKSFKQYRDDKEQSCIREPFHVTVNPTQESNVQFIDIIVKINQCGGKLYQNIIKITHQTI